MRASSIVPLLVACGSLSACGGATLPGVFPWADEPGFTIDGDERVSDAASLPTGATTISTEGGFASNGRLDGEIGPSVSLHHEARDLTFFDDGFFTQVNVTARREDGSWGMAILLIDGSLARLPLNEPLQSDNSGSSLGPESDLVLSIIGCAGPAPEAMDFDAPADASEFVLTAPEGQLDDPSGLNVRARATFLAHWNGPGMGRIVKGQFDIVGPR